MNASLPTPCRSACRPFTLVIGDELRAGLPSTGLRPYAFLPAERPSITPRRTRCRSRAAL
jgi:hypothetical protein